MMPILFYYVFDADAAIVADAAMMIDAADIIDYFDSFDDASLFTL